MMVGNVKRSEGTHHHIILEVVVTVLNGILLRRATGKGALAATLVICLAAPAQAQQVRELNLVHGLGASQHKALSELAENFNGSQKQVRVVVTQGKVDQEALPDMFILEGADTESFLRGKPRFKPLAAAMREAKVPLKTAKGPQGLVDRDIVDAKGALQALPIGLATPVLYVNRDILRGAGLDPETPLATWDDMQPIIGRLAQSGSKCPFTFMQPASTLVENLNAWHNEPNVVIENKVEQPAFNGMLAVKHLAKLATWQTAGLLRVYGSDQEAVTAFRNGQCAMLTGPSSLWRELREDAGRDYRVTVLPYHEGTYGAPQNTLASGAALWLASGRKAADYKAMASFVDYWLQPKNQVAWQLETGYLPLNRAGYFAAQSDLLGEELENVRVAVAQLGHKAPTSDSSSSVVMGRAATHAAIDAALRNLWSGQKPAKKALDDAVSELRTTAAAPAAR